MGDLLRGGQGFLKPRSAPLRKTSLSKWEGMETCRRGQRGYKEREGSREEGTQAQWGWRKVGIHWAYPSTASWGDLLSVSNERGLMAAWAMNIMR